MNTVEARAILDEELQRHRSRSYSELVTLVGSELRAEARGRSGTSYQVEVQFHWDDRPRGHVRVLGSIDDGGWRAFLPLSESFIMAPDGSFVGE